MKLLLKTFFHIILNCHSCFKDICLETKIDFIQEDRHF